MLKMKWTALLALVLAALLPCAALAAAGDVNLARNDEMREKYQDGVYGGCVVGDALYLYGSEHIYTYRIGDADLTAVEYQLPEADEEESRNVQKMFSDGENLYALCVLNYYGEDGYGVRSAEIYPVEVGEDAAVIGEPVEVDISELTVSYGGDESYFMQINSACYVGGYLMLYGYSDDGEECLYQLDIETGEGSFVEDAGRIHRIAAYADDQLLIQSYDYEASAYTFSLYDPQSGGMTAACPPLDRDASIGGIAYSTESGKLFYMSGGYVMAVEDFDFENAQQVAELSTLYYSEDSGMLLPGDYYVYASYEGTSIRATDPDAMPETRITVRGGGYADSLMAAYYSFGNTHGDVAVVLDQTYMQPSAIIEAMMGRDSTVDIFMASVSGEAYDALYNRGYMVELDNEEILSAVGKMYPAIQEVLTRDGDVVAIPMSVYGWTMGLDYEGFEKLGIPREDVPDNWSDLLDLLPELAEKLPEDGSIQIFDSYYTQTTARESLIDAIMESWRIHQSAVGQEAGYDSPELIKLLDKAMEMDYEALGVPDDDTDEEERYRVIEYSSGGDRNYTLLETSVGCTIGNFYSNCEPALLSVIPGEPGNLPLDVSVAFVNPFSENVELAQEFLVELMKQMSDETAYNLSDEKNEPVRYSYTLEVMQEYQETLDKLHAELETADPVDVPDIEEQISETEMILEDLDRYGWSIPQKDIDWYRGHDDRIAVKRYDFLYAADENGEISDLAEQFLAGKISSENFLKEIDRKVRMRALEGN